MADDFLSGSIGTVSGPRPAAEDRVLDAWLAVRRIPERLDRAARDQPPRRSVLALAVVRPDLPNLIESAHDELERSRHDVELAVRSVGDLGKFQNLNALLAEHPLEGRDWLLVLDDDVALPKGFLDRFLFLVERFDLAIAQPAHRRRSHAAWEVTRRRPRSLVRETQFVETGPVSAFRRDTFDVLLPFPDVCMGWGIDAHWSAIARERGWRLGVVDAVPVAHALRPVAATYSSEAAIAEARAFLADRPYVRAEEAQRTLAVHRRW